MAKWHDVWQPSLIFTVIASPLKPLEEFCWNLAYEFLSMPRCVCPKTILVVDNWAMSRENLFYSICEQQRHDQPAHLRSLISVFVVCCLDSIILTLAKSKHFKTLASDCSWAGWFESNLVANPRRQVFSWRGSNMAEQHQSLKSVIAHYSTMY